MHKFYVVIKGNTPGIFREWYGPNGAEEQIKGFHGSIHKSFLNIEDAQRYFMENASRVSSGESFKNREYQAMQVTNQIAEWISAGSTLVFSDGAYSSSSNKGGWGILIIRGGVETHTRSGAFELTTSPRMELYAFIQGLHELQEGEKSVLFTDSKYISDGLNERWAYNWRDNDWRKDNGNIPANIDLWAQLLPLYDKLKPEVIWVPSHAGVLGNEDVDKLAKEAILSCESPQVDSVYASQSI